MARPRLQPKPLSAERAQRPSPYLVSSADGPSSVDAEQYSTAGQPAAGRLRAVGIIAGFALVAAGAAGALIYFAGPMVGIIIIAAFSALVAWGNWILDNTIEL